jgi:hypothetical protein
MKTFICVLSLMLCFPLLASATSAEKLLESSDRARGGVAKGVVWEAELVSIEEGDTTQRNFTVKVKGNNALVEITSPPRNRGEKFLFNDLVMWFHKPSLRKPVTVSSRQRNSGQASNGDIANIQYARDYSGAIIGSEKINNEDTWVLSLKAKSKEVTYDQIKYWISKKSLLGVKAEFLTLQGKPFKNAIFEYGNSITSGGKKEPFISKMIITDSEFPQNKSILNYKEPQAKELSDSLFNVNNLTR